MGEFIVTKELLKKRRCTMAQFARDIGVSPTYIQMLIKGESKYPASEKLIEKAKDWLKCCHVCGQRIRSTDV